MTVLPIPSRFECICCGARHISKQEAQRRVAVELCGACSDECERWLRRTRGRATANDVNKWLARRLFLDAERFELRGVTGRCEAVAHGSSGWRRAGFSEQCRGRAVAIRDGRKVCGGHNRATDPTFVGGPMHNPYDSFRAVLSRLISADPKFRDCVAAALVDHKEDAA